MPQDQDQDQDHVGGRANNKRELLALLNDPRNKQDFYDCYINDIARVRTLLERICGQNPFRYNVLTPCSPTFRVFWFEENCHCSDMY